MDEESAILGLPGNRETRLKLDADHSNMCKVGKRGAMYKLIVGNIKQIVDQVLAVEREYIPQLSLSTALASPAQHLNSSIAYSVSKSSRSKAEITGTLYEAVDNDSRSLQIADHENHGRWDEARKLAYAVFHDHARTLGKNHLSTLRMAYHLSEIELEARCLAKAARWCEWVSHHSERQFDKRHPLFLKAQSVMGEILCRQGRAQEGESVCANALARQQMTLGENDLDTLATRRRIAIADMALGRRQQANDIVHQRTATLKKLVGSHHIKVWESKLDSVEVTLVQHPTADHMGRIMMRYEPQARQNVDMVARISKELHGLLGPLHPLSIRALRLYGYLQLKINDCPREASETLRRALASAEESLGTEHPETMNIVAYIGLSYATQGSTGRVFLKNTGQNIELALPWLQRYFRWAKTHVGLSNPEAQGMLQLLGQLYMSVQQYPAAQHYYELQVSACEQANIPVPGNARQMLQLCRSINTRVLPTPRP